MEQKTESQRIAGNAQEAAAARSTARALTGEQDMTYEACAALAESVGLSVSDLVRLAK